MANKISNIFSWVCILSCAFSIFLITTSQSQKTYGTYRSTTTAISSLSENKRATDSKNIIEEQDSTDNKSNFILEKNKAKNKTASTADNPINYNNKRFKNGNKNGTSYNMNKDFNNYNNNYTTTTEVYTYNENEYYENTNNVTETESKHSTSTENHSISMIGVIGKKEFHYADQNMRFGGAIEFCLSHNMALATIESEFENNLVKNFFDSVENHKYGWLGATDGFSRKGEFLWMKNREPISYISWADGYPRSDERTSCINFNNGEWKNWSCDYFGTENEESYIRPICEKEI